MSKKRDLSIRAVAAESRVRELEAANRSLETKLAVASTVPPAPATPPAPPATPALDRLAQLQAAGQPLLAASSALAHADEIRSELASRAAAAAPSPVPAAPAPPPPPPPAVVPPVTPTPPPVRTFRDVYRELQQKSPYLAAQHLLAHAHHLDAPAPATAPAGA